MTMVTTKKSWVEAATIIALARNKVNSNISNGYKILSQKRSDKAKFMPNNIVFPGGVADKSDFDKQWIDLIKSFNIPNEKFKQFYNSDIILPLIFQNNDDPNLKHIALRITAIRETFEEVGLLLCKSRNDKETNNSSSLIHPNFNLIEWQKRVNKNPSEFFSLCEHLDCYPDIWGLHLWSNWLTPTTKPKRFNTAFFITFLDDQPNVHIDKKEVSEYTWSTPSDILESFKSKRLMLATPQWYELSKLSISKDFDELQKYAVLRNSYGCELMFPIYHKTKDSTIVSLPGDSLYPKCPDLVSDYKLFLEDKTDEELRTNNDRLHRITYHDAYNLSCHVKNHTSKYYEMTPLSTSIPKLPII